MATLKDEIAELKNNQKIMQEQIAQMQQIIDNMKKEFTNLTIIICILSWEAGFRNPFFPFLIL